MPPSYKRNYDGYNYNSYKRPKTSNLAPVMNSLFKGSFNRSSNTYQKKSYGSSRRGPYKTLTTGNRHTNPVYPKPELKLYDADHAGVSPPATPAAAITNAGTVVCCNRMVTGTGVQQFTGNQVAVKSVAYRFEVDLPATSANQVMTSGRVMLVWDKQPNGNIAAYTDIFSTASYLSFANVNTRERFVILRNDQISLSPNGQQTVFLERFVKVNMLTTFTNAQAAPAAPITGALLLVYISDQGTPANQPTITGLVRVRYYDN